MFKFNSKYFSLSFTFRDVFCRSPEGRKREEEDRKRREKKDKTS
jgi:hypothetical protein